MRKNSPRKWLHAILDLLPVILIPIFMVYSHRHTLTENAEASIQYKYQSNEVNTIDDLVEGNIYRLDIENLSVDELVSVDGGFSFKLLSVYEYDFSNYSFDLTDVFSYASNFDSTVTICFNVSNYNGYLDVYLGENNNGDYTFELELGGLDNDLFTFKADVLYESSYLITNLVDVLSYTDYNEISSVDFSDTNIMSVFSLNLNDTINQYFNMTEVFNLKDFWTWIDINLFNGNAPVMANVIWNIIVYEFVVDLLFLFYAFFMFLIDFTENLLDKPFNKGR